MRPALRCRLPLLLCLLCLTSCIVTFRDFPQVDPDATPLSAKPYPLYYDIPSFSGSARAAQSTFYFLFSYFYPVVTGDPTTVVEVETVFRESGRFSEAVRVSKLPEKGVYCFVDWKPKSASDVAGAATQIFPFLLPYYSGESGMIITYSLYLNGTFRKDYRYEITKKGMGWILFLPFAWINFFTTDEAEAIRATAYQFLLDAERDGLLATSLSQ